MGVDFKIIDPLHHPGWDDLILAGSACSFFHSSSWARVLSESYRFRPLFFCLADEARLSATVPLMEISSFLTGHRAVSMPFSDYCEPIACGQGEFNELFARVVEHGKKKGWKYVELRGGARFLESVVAVKEYLHHELKLSIGEDALRKGLKDTTARNIRKAEKEGVSVSVLDTIDSVREFYRLHRMTRKDHGLPPQPYRFFEKIHEHVIRNGLGHVVLASWGGACIAGAVYFSFGKRVIYKYGAMDKRYQHLRPANRVMWEAILRYASGDYETLDFGRTDAGDSGLIRFKTGWGAEQGTLRYYRYDLQKETFVSCSPGSGRFGKKMLKMMPAAVLGVIGELFYRHMD